MEAMEKWGKNRRGWVQRIRGMKKRYDFIRLLFRVVFKFFVVDVFEWG
jgi:hypothetical protein